MTDQPRLNLPEPQTLALAWTPTRARGLTGALFALDAHCAGLVRQSKEPMLAQMRLAWWRQMLAQPPSARPRGDALLDSLAAWTGAENALAEMVAGWEYLLGDPPLAPAAMERFAEARAQGFGALARQLGHERAEERARAAGRGWALTDLALHLAHPAERASALALADSTLVATGGRLPRDLRGLAVLYGLSRRSVALGGVPLLAGRGAALVALRLGMTGR